LSYSWNEMLCPDKGLKHAMGELLVYAGISNPCLECVVPVSTVALMLCL
jgi:hypothetical protein